MSKKLSPLGLVAQYPAVIRHANVSIVGASISGEAGSVVVTAPSARKSHVSALGLVTQAKTFDVTPEADVFVNITGAQITTQVAHPDSAHATIYPDSAAITAEAGDISDDTAFVSGAAIAGQAGTVTVDISTAHGITGAQITSGAGAVTGIGGSGATDVGATITGAEAAAEAGTVTLAVDWYQSITGAQINAEAANVGIDTGSSPADVAATITGAQIVAQAGSVSFAELAKAIPTGHTQKRSSKRRYVIEVDNKLFDVANVAEATALLTQVRTVAKEAAKANLPITPVQIKVTTAAGQETRQSTILSEIRTTKLAVNKAIEQQSKAVDEEIAFLLTRKLSSEDDEDAILALLLG